MAVPLDSHESARSATWPWKCGKTGNAMKVWQYVPQCQGSIWESHGSVAVPHLFTEVWQCHWIHIGVRAVPHDHGSVARPVVKGGFGG